MRKSTKRPKSTRAPQSVLANISRRLELSGLVDRLASHHQVHTTLAAAMASVPTSEAIASLLSVRRPGLWDAPQPPSSPQDLERAEICNHITTRLNETIRALDSSFIALKEGVRETWTDLVAHDMMTSPADDGDDADLDDEAIDAAALDRDSVQDRRLREAAINHISKMCVSVDSWAELMEHVRPDAHEWADIMRTQDHWLLCVKAVERAWTLGLEKTSWTDRITPEVGPALAWAWRVSHPWHLAAEQTSCNPPSSDPVLQEERDRATLSEEWQSLWQGHAVEFARSERPDHQAIHSDLCGALEAMGVRPNWSSSVLSRFWISTDDLKKSALSAEHFGECLEKMWSLDPIGAERVFGSLADPDLPPIKHAEKWFTDWCSSRQWSFVRCLQHASDQKMLSGPLLLRMAKKEDGRHPQSSADGAGPTEHAVQKAMNALSTQIMSSRNTSSLSRRM